MNKLTFSVEFDFQPEDNECKTWQDFCGSLAKQLDAGFFEFKESVVDYFYRDSMCPMLDNFCDVYNADFGVYNDEVMTNELPRVYTEEFLEAFRQEFAQGKAQFATLFKIKDKSYACGESGPRVYFDIEETAALAKFREKFLAQQPKAPEPTEEAEIAELKRLLKRHGKKFLGLAE